MTSNSPIRSATMSDVAAEAGVSRQLVSLVVRNVGYVAEDKRRLVLAAAAKLGYRHNRLAANLAAKRSNTIGMAVLDIHNQVYADFADGIRSVIQPEGFQLLLSLGDAGSDSGQKGIESLIGLRVDGLIVGTHFATGDGFLESLAGIPTVTLGETSGVPNVDSVRADDYKGAKAAVNHLTDQGHTRIAYLAGPDIAQNRERQSGYIDALAESNLAPLIVAGNATEASGYAGATQVIRQNPDVTAVFCYNDSTAFGALEAMQREKIRVPEDTALIGFDNTRASQYPGIQLTTVDPHAFNIGAAAAKLLLARISEPSSPEVNLVLDPRLIIRQSSSLTRAS